MHPKLNEWKFDCGQIEDLDKCLKNNVIKTKYSRFIDRVGMSSSILFIKTSPFSFSLILSCCA